jgi:hypothetical protein
LGRDGAEHATEPVRVPLSLDEPQSVSVNSPQARSSLRSMKWIIVM